MPWFAIWAAVALALPAARAATPPARLPVSPIDRIEPLVKIGDALPAGYFYDQGGSRVSFASMHGDVVALAFVYTRCRDECPVITQKFRQLRDDLRGGPYRLAEVTIDPAHDSVSVLSTYARGFDARLPQWLFLTGPVQTVETFDQEMGVSAIGAGGGEIFHNDRVALVAPDGTVADFVDGSSWTAADLAAQMRQIDGQGGSLLGRLDLAAGAAIAYCGGVIAGRAGLLDMIASLAVIAGFAAVLFWFARRLFAGTA
jgi:protein SCO1